MQATSSTIGGSGIKFSQRAIEVLDLIRQSGGMLCTGSCHHQKKGELHCRQIGKILNMSFSTVWDQVNYLLNEGLVERKRVNDGPVIFEITLKGDELLCRGDAGSS